VGIPSWVGWRDFLYAVGWAAYENSPRTDTWAPMVDSEGSRPSLWARLEEHTEEGFRWHLGRCIFPHLIPQSPCPTRCGTLMPTGQKGTRNWIFPRARAPREGPLRCTQVLRFVPPWCAPPHSGAARGSLWSLPRGPMELDQAVERGIP